MTNEKTIGKLIEHEVRKQGIPIKKFAEMIYCQRNNAYNLFGRSKIDIILLKRICEALNHNFFQDLADDLSLIDEVGDAEKDKAVVQFYNVVPKILKEMGKSSSIILGDLPDDVDSPVPDFILPDYIISFTVGNTFMERSSKRNPLLSIEKISNDEGIEIELLTNLLHQTRSQNIVLDYKTEEEWRDTLTFAFELYERFNISQLWKQRRL